MRLERTQQGFLAALAATIPVSIFAAELALVLGALLLGLRLVRGETRFEATPLDAPLLAYGVWTVLSASFAAEPAVALEDSKELLLFLLFYLGVATLTRDESRDGVMSALFLGGLALSALMVIQYHLLGDNTLDRRPSGFLGHYMSSSGVVMGVVVSAAAWVAFRPAPSRPGPRDLWLLGAVLAGVGVVAAFQAASIGGEWPTRLFVAALAAGGAALALSPRSRVRGAASLLPWAAVPLGAWALVVSQTRNAWVGVLAGLVVVAVLRAPKLLFVLAGALAVLLLLRPAAVQSRLTVRDASTVDRYYMWQAGVDMILDKPVFGQGPGMIINVYPRYKWPEAPNPRQPHLHNNALQIAATRGLPGFAFFAWWVVIVLATALAEARRSAPSWTAVAALGGLVALLVAGLFEYNLGDSEVLLLALLLSALPFAGRRGETPNP